MYRSELDRIVARLHEKNPVPPPNPAPYNRDACFKWFHHTRSDHWWKTQMTFSGETLLAVIGDNNHANRGKLMKRDPLINRGIIQKIGFVIPDIEARKIAFPGGTNPRYVSIDPPEVIPHIGKLSSVWSLWARCATCGDNKFIPVMIDGKEQVACYHCLPPSQFGSIGAREVKKSLIQEALKMFY